MKFKKKPVEIEAITFEELVTYGLINAESLVGGVPWHFKYKGHTITHETDDCYLIPTLEGTMRFNRGEMLITDVKGEIYPCKMDIFEATYVPGCQGTRPKGLNFGEAVEALKQGKRVAREGWNGKEMFVFMQVPAVIPPDIIPKMQSLPQTVKDAFGLREAPISYSNQLALVKPDNSINGWAPSTADALAEDWMVLDYAN